MKVIGPGAVALSAQDIVDYWVLGVIQLREVRRNKRETRFVVEAAALDFLQPHIGTTICVPHETVRKIQQHKLADRIGG